MKTQNNNQNRFYFRCSNCKNIIILEEEADEDFILDCPNCGKNGIIKSIKQNDKRIYQSNEFIQLKKFIETEKGLYKQLLQVNLIGIVLIIIGMIYLLITSSFNIKFGLTIILLGIVILGLLPGRKHFFVRMKKIINKENNEDIHINRKNLSFSEILRYKYKKFEISEKISFAIIILIIFLYIVTGVNNLEIFLIFVYLGLLIIKVLANEFIPNYLKKRMNLFIIGFLVIFVIIIIKKVISVVSI